MKVLFIAALLFCGVFAQVDETIAKLEKSSYGKKILDTI